MKKYLAGFVRIVSVVILLTPIPYFLKAQQGAPTWSELPPLPVTEGCAGMYAGVTGGALLCMGGTNFPDKKPWEGGVKKWYDAIYLYQKDKNWILLPEKLSHPMAYGVTVTFRNSVILVGGSTATEHSSQVTGYTWNGASLLTTDYPALPIPLAYMTGALVNDVIIVAGGSSSPRGAPLNKCYALDLNEPQGKWISIDPWPGPERVLPACAVYQKRFYLFSGEKTGISASNQPFREILQDAYQLTISRNSGKWNGSWKKLSPMPRGASAAGSPLPTLSNKQFLLWGGVDAVSALKKTPSAGADISQDFLLYNPDSDTWEYGGAEDKRPARVTLPVVFMNNQWVYLNGEIRSGVRTNTIVTVH